MKISTAGPVVAFLVMAGLGLLAVLWSRSHPDGTLVIAAKEYVEAVARLSCGPAHQSDGCVERLTATCRRTYGELCATFLLLSPSSMRSIEADRGSRELSAALIDEAKLRKLGSNITQRTLVPFR